MRHAAAARHLIASNIMFLIVSLSAPAHAAIFAPQPFFILPAPVTLSEQRHAIVTLHFICRLLCRPGLCLR